MRLTSPRSQLVREYGGATLGGTAYHSASWRRLAPCGSWIASGIAIEEIREAGESRIVPGTGFRATRATFDGAGWTRTSDQGIMSPVL